MGSLLFSFNFIIFYFNKTEWMPNIWAYEAINSKKPINDEKGIGICCFN